MRCEQERMDALDDWFQQPLGRCLFEYEQTLVHTVLEQLYGYYLLQPALPNVFMACRSNNIVQPITVQCPDPSVTCEKPTFWGEQTALPILSNTIDLVLLPHVLEFAAQPTNMLAEYFRVLKPDGHLLLLGFNPYSLFGLYRYWARRSQAYPWSGRFLSKRLVLMWLKAMSCHVVRNESFGFYFPGLAEQRTRLAHQLEQSLQLCLPWWSAAYLLVIRKKVTPLTLIRPRWQKKPALASRFLEPSANREIERTNPMPRHLSPPLDAATLSSSSLLGMIQ